MNRKQFEVRYCKLISEKFPSCLKRMLYRVGITLIMLLIIFGFTVYYVNHIFTPFINYEVLKVDLSKYDWEIKNLSNYANKLCNSIGEINDPSQPEFKAKMRELDEASEILGKILLEDKRIRHEKIVKSVTYIMALSPLLYSISHILVGFLIVKYLRNYAREEQIKAEDTQNERTDVFRQNYIAKHKDEILARTDEIKRKHEERILNTRQREYFDEFISTKVYEMWDEEYKLWQIATGYYDAPKKEIPIKDKSDIVFKEELQRKKKQEDLKIKKLAIEAFSLIKGRSMLQSEYKKFEVKILKGRILDELSEEELRNLEDLKDMYQQSLDRLGNNM